MQKKPNTGYLRKLKLFSFIVNLISMLFMNQLLKADIYCHLKEGNEQLQLLNIYEKSFKKNLPRHGIFSGCIFLSHS